MRNNTRPTDKHQVPGGKQNSPLPLKARLFCVGLLFLAALVPGFSAQAQQATPQTNSPEAVPVILEVDTREFPQIRAVFRVPGSTPGTGYGGGADNVQVLENDEIIQPGDLREEYTGIHFALAVNPCYSLALRDQQGISNYQKMVEQIRGLRLFFNADAGDSFDLFINPDRQSVGLTNFDGFLSELDAYQENMRAMTGSLDSLEAAINSLMETKDNKDRVLIYLTENISLPEAERFSGLLRLAAQNAIPVHVWMVLDQSGTQTARYSQMEAEIGATGGSLTALTGTQSVPSPRYYLAGLGKTFSVIFNSNARKSGTQTLVIEARTAQGFTRSAPANFDITVLPPSLVFINPPETLALVIREVASAETLEPTELPLEVSITFPDNHPRGIQYASLWVNGVQTQRKDEAPYGSYVLALEGYTQVAILNVEVRMLDELGLEASTETLSIPLQVTREADATKSAWFKNTWVLAGVGLGVLAFLGLVLLPGLRKAFARPVAPAPLSTPPSPIPVKSLASLVRLDPDLLPAAEKPILIQEELTLIGNDPALANLLLVDASLEPLHAQLRIEADGTARLTDFNTRAGTQVNFVPVDTRGSALSHGDIIHFGKLGYRFSSSTRTLAGVANKKTPPTKRT